MTLLYTKIFVFSLKKGSIINYLTAGPSIALDSLIRPMSYVALKRLKGAFKDLTGLKCSSPGSKGPLTA